VSAPVVAKERGMVVDEVVRAAQSDYESLITVSVSTERQERSVSGTVYHDGKPRLVDIKGIRVDAEFGKSMIYVTNEDKPGFIGAFASLLGDVNVVSAPVVAKERGMVVDEVVRAAQSDYESLITVTVVTERQERSVSGTVYADGKPRMVDIKGIRVDAEFGRSMIYVTNEDKPGFIGKFASLLGDAKINIATFHLGRVKQGGDAIALVEIDGAVPAELLAKIQALPQVKQVKVLVF